jgi:DNA-binding response OmpR family regulator
MSTRVLCVHKDVDHCQPIKVTLEQAGYEVLFAKDGTEALHMMSAVRVDGVVLDTKLDAAGGASLRFQLQHAHPGIPFLMFSNEHEVGSLPLSILRAYLNDPGPPERLLFPKSYN